MGKWVKFFNTEGSKLAHKKENVKQPVNGPVVEEKDVYQTGFGTTNLSSSTPPVRTAQKTPPKETSDFRSGKAGSAYVSSYKQKFIKKTISKKLVILMIQDNMQSYPYKDIFGAFADEISSDELVVIFKYGSDIARTPIMSKPTLSVEDIQCVNEFGVEARFYDVFPEIMKLCMFLYGKTLDYADGKVKITSVEITGLGTAEDTCSATTREQAAAIIAELTKLGTNHSSKDEKMVRTKYFCLTAEDAIRASSLGFRAIGTFEREF